MENGNMNEKICLVTGANSGIGKVTAKVLAAGGATVIMACRNRDKGEAARGEIVKETRNENIDLLIVDFSDLGQIRNLAAGVKAKYQRLDTLVNNAGTYFSKRMITVDGYEATFAVNHLGYFLLTVELLDLMKSSLPARIVNVASGAHRGGHIDFDDLNLEKDYSGWKAYGRSKLANVLFTYELARRLVGAGVTANCLHPGAVSTNLLNKVGGLPGKIMRLFTPFMRTPEKGADTMIWLASSPEVEGITGKYFVDRKAQATRLESYDAAVAARLWEASERMCNSAGVVPGEDQLPRSNGSITTGVVTARLFSEGSNVDDCDWPPQSNDFSRNGAVTTKVVTARLFSEESDVDDCDWPPRRNGVVTTEVVTTRLYSEENDAVEPIAIIGIHGFYPHSANL